jgi:hypothetical protein
LAAGLTALSWMPTADLLPRIERFSLMRSWASNPPSHHLGIEWLMTLAAPNVLGTPQSGTWTAPANPHPAVIDDYGEVASGYAGVLALTFACASLLGPRRRPFWFFAALAILTLATIAEFPLWREALRSIPFAGVTLHQRLRILWNLSVCALGTLFLDQLRHGDSLPTLRRASAVIAGIIIFIWTVRGHRISDAVFGYENLLLPLAVLASFLVAAFLMPRFAAPVAAALALVELIAITRGYNPVAQPADIFPVTGAIQAMTRSKAAPYRIAALGWSFLPETPAYYGLEDVKTTNPVQDPRAMRMIRGYVRATGYDEIIQDVSEPFFDFLNVRFIYAPPGEPLRDPRFVTRYAGRDGYVFENTRVLPRYFLVQRFMVEPNFDWLIAKSKRIRDYSRDATATHLPPQVSRRAPELLRADSDGFVSSAGGTAHVRVYEANRTVLDVDSRGWSLLVSSDVDWVGWRAYWNGKREPTVTVNGAFVGCFIPPGRGEFQLIYRPDAFINGLRISVLSILLLIGAAVFRRVLLRPSAGPTAR